MNQQTDHLDDALAVRIQLEAPMLRTLWDACQRQLEKAGFADLYPESTLQYGIRELRRDPFDGSDALYSEWRHHDGRRIGNALIRADGNVYAELDVLKPHPEDARWFVEGVAAWGNTGNVKTELKLLPALGS